jgi:hypothetical protein
MSSDGILDASNEMSPEETLNAASKPQSFQFEFAHEKLGEWSHLQSCLYSVFIVLAIMLADSIPTYTAMYGRLTKQELLYALRGGLSAEHKKIMYDCDSLMKTRIADRTPEEIKLLSERAAPVIILNRLLGNLAVQMFPEEVAALKAAKAAK